MSAEEKWNKNPVISIRNKRTGMARQVLVFVKAGTKAGEEAKQAIQSAELLHKFYEKK